MGGDRGREPGRIGGGRGTGCGRGKGGRWEFQKGEITQHCIIFRNRKRAKGRKPRKKGREPGLQGTGGGRFGPPVPSPPTKVLTLR